MLYFPGLFFSLRVTIRMSSHLHSRWDKYSHQQQEKWHQIHVFCLLEGSISPNSSMFPRAVRAPQLQKMRKVGLYFCSCAGRSQRAKGSFEWYGPICPWLEMFADSNPLSVKGESSPRSLPGHSQTPEDLISSLALGLQLTTSSLGDSCLPQPQHLSLEDDVCLDVFFFLTCIYFVLFL